MSNQLKLELNKKTGNMELTLHGVDNLAEPPEFKFVLNNEEFKRFLSLGSEVANGDSNYPEAKIDCVVEVIPENLVDNEDEEAEEEAEEVEPEKV